MSNLVGEKSELALLAVEGWTIVDHLWMNFNLEKNRTV
jgi:hypothetical protein